ncbi:DNA-binding protein [Mycobacterium antarcticum]|uniref:YbaB/EbfC family nucleoid-associated protein n=1 Tax=unclassified Mycolicibacterium TaxID=2636767 RepID=UPI0023A16583|nr:MULTISPECIES: YbaB/EbfC family nucleoid-associated protein [unclassified Mycolicibacterium]BDX29547.1 DNA-binding protein [Mycolicibacterium sp. TUM20985]GLP72978.1 DNA-binding protein [Mycolicibacterium sp. TUM20983]
MTEDMHPQVASVLKQAQRLQSLMDDQLEKMAGESFTATDETETVEVTLNGHHWLTEVFIEEGLLRLGAETVEARVNEALQNAGASAAASMEADRERIDSVVAEITSELNDANE